MSPRTKKWLGILTQDYGVEAEFCDHLVPFLERFSAEEPGREECEQMLRAIAAAYRACESSAERQPFQEVRALLGQFVTEMKKLDESLKVLSAYLERVRQHIYSLPSGRILH